MKMPELSEFSYSPGYSDMRGARHSERLEKTADGDWLITCRDREHFGAPEIVTVYAVSNEAAAEFEEFIIKKRIKKLSRRLKRRVFVTDYSPWEFFLVFKNGAEENGEPDDFCIEEHRIYLPSDRVLLKELLRRFRTLRGNIISETAVKERD